MDPSSKQKVTYTSALYQEFEYNHAISTWVMTDDFIVLGSFSGSLFFYDKQNPKNYTLIASAELMDPITKIYEAVAKDNISIFVIGTKEGNLATIKLNAIDRNIHNWKISVLISSIGQQIVDIFLSRSPESLIIVFSHSVSIFNLRIDENDRFHLLDKRVLYNTEKDKENSIFQCSIYQHKLLISTMKSYFTINTLIDKINQIGSREKKVSDGKLGSCYCQDENKNIYIYAARKNGIIWRADPTEGSVKISLQFKEDNGSSLVLGLLYGFGFHLISIGEKMFHIIDPCENKLIYEECFNDEYYFYTDDANVLKDEFTINSQYKKNVKNKMQFYILIKKPTRVIIKEYKLLSILEAFEFSFKEDKITRAIELFEQHQILHNLDNARRIFNYEGLNMQMLSTKFENFCKIVQMLEDKKIEEESNQIPIIIDLETSYEEKKLTVFKSDENFKIEQKKIEMRGKNIQYTIETKEQADLRSKISQEILDKLAKDAQCKHLDYDYGRIRLFNQIIKKRWKKYMEYVRLCDLIFIVNDNLKRRQNENINQIETIKLSANVKDRVKAISQAFKMMHPLELIKINDDIIGYNYDLKRWIVEIAWKYCVDLIIQRNLITEYILCWSYNKQIISDDLHQQFDMIENRFNRQQIALTKEEKIYCSSIKKLYELFL